MEREAYDEKCEKAGMWRRDVFEERAQLHHLCKGDSIDVRALGERLDHFTNDHRIQLMRWATGPG